MSITGLRPKGETLSADEQLGSPGFSIEAGWLAGVCLASTAVFWFAIRRSAERRRIERSSHGEAPRG